MKVVIVIQEQQKMNDVLSVLRKRSKSFSSQQSIQDIMDWVESYVNRVGDIKFIPLDKD